MVGVGILGYKISRKNVPDRGQDVWPLRVGEALVSCLTQVEVLMVGRDSPVK